jgi:hypothetical protein
VAKRGNYVSWSEEEKAFLVEAWARPEGLKKIVLLFNGRTVDSIKDMAHKLRLPAKSTGPANRGGPNEALVLQLLDLRPMDVNELAAKLGISNRAAGFRVNDLHAAGRIHITKWERFSPHGAPSRMWALGPGEDALRPKPIAKKILERRRINRMRKDDPAAYEAVLARKRTKQQIRNGMLVKRDSAVAALFGHAAQQPSTRSTPQLDASPCA